VPAFIRTSPWSRRPDRLSSFVQDGGACAASLLVVPKNAIFFRWVEGPDDEDEAIRGPRCAIQSHEEQRQPTNSETHHAEQFGVCSTIEDDVRRGIERPRHDEVAVSDCVPRRSGYGGGTYFFYSGIGLSFDFSSARIILSSASKRALQSWRCRIDPGRPPLPRAHAKPEGF